jgi:prevent-host-death family protein
MKSSLIGIREAKAQLSRLVDEAGRGTEWIITDRGRPVAKLIPLSDVDEPVKVRVARLEHWGWIEAQKKGPRQIPPPVRISGDAQRMLQEDRAG